MISIGQLIGRACGVLWRRRLPVLGIVLAWLVLDGLLLSQLKLYWPNYGQGLLRWLRDLLGDAVLISHGFRFPVSILTEMLRDGIRAVFVVLLLRSFLAPSSVGLLKPIWLIFLFELAWTVVLHPVEYGMREMVSQRIVDPSADFLLIASAKALVYIASCLALSRLCFVYGNVTLGLGWQFGRSWRETRGLAGRLFLLFLAIPLPLAVLGSFLNVQEFMLDLLRESVHHYVLAILAAESVEFILSGVPILAVIAVAYVAATGAPSMAIPGANRTSGQLAEAFD